MKETNNLHITIEQEADSLADGEKRTWQPPVLLFLGRLRDLVQGGGKSGGNIDGDQNSQGKHGIG